MDGLLGRLLQKPVAGQPVGGDTKQWMRTTANEVDGIPIGFTTYRPADLTGLYPEWREFAYNVGDVDMPPIGIPLGPRHLSIYARAPFLGAA